MLGLRYRDGVRAEQARGAALAAARKAAPAVLSYDYRHPDRDFAAARDRITGDFGDEYRKTMSKAVGPKAKKYHGIVRATVAQVSGDAPAASARGPQPGPDDHDPDLGRLESERRGRALKARCQCERLSSDPMSSLEVGCTTGLRSKGVGVGGAGVAKDAAVAARARGLTKAYGSGETQVLALDAVDVDIARGRFTAVMGPSGSGKSTLMHCLAGLDTVSAGQVWLGDTEITGLKERELTRLRRDRIGFMFQSFNLIPTLNAAENITLPMDIAGKSPDPKWLEQVIDTLGLRDRLKHRPAQLSGGQQQRVACARALAARPELIFADEPTGNLDSRAGLEVLGFLRQSVDELGQTVVMVTHDPGAAAHADLVLFLGDGRLVDEMREPTAEAVLERLKQFDVVRHAVADKPGPRT